MLHEIEKAISRAPIHMQYGLTHYVMHGRESGRFLVRLLRGDRAWALSSADPANAGALISGQWDEVLSALPPECWGSADAVVSWMARGGLMEDAA